MKLLEKYLAKTIISAIGLITVMLIGLEGFILFVNQIGDIGRGNYHISQAILFVLLQLPYQIYLFFPMASLLGTLLGLSVLANHSELIIIRAAGLSVSNITCFVLKTGFLLILLVTLVGETVVPSLSRLSNSIKGEGVSGGQTLTTSQGIWMRVGPYDFLNIGAITRDTDLASVYQFHFLPNNAMQFARKINRLHLNKGKWEALGVEESSIEDNQVTTKFYSKIDSDLFIDPLLLRVSSKQPDEMNLLALGQYLLAQKKAHQLASPYELVFWQRIFQPLTTVVMMILAIPFIFGPLRSSSMGSKLVTGASIGFGFYVMHRFVGPFSQVYQWPPIIAALGPTVLFAIIGVYLMRRVR